MKNEGTGPGTVVASPMGAGCYGVRIYRRHTIEHSRKAGSESFAQVFLRDARES
jgi:hypothetical protein